MRKRLSLVIGISFAFLMTSCGMSTQSVQEDSIQSNQEEILMDSDFAEFENVELIGVDTGKLSDEEREILLRQAEYCQAMTDADTDKMREIVSEDMVFVHMSGRKQSREEYLADIEDGSLDYYTIGIEKPVIEVDGDRATITYTSVLNANAYGARGSFRMSGTHAYEKVDGNWMLVNR